MSASTAEIERALERVAGVHAAVEERGEDLVVSGLVGTRGEHEAALDIVASLAPEKRIVDNIDIVEVMPEEIDGLSLSEAAAGGFPTATPNTSDDESLEPGDFTDQDILTNAIGAAGPSGTADQQISEGDEAYVPPTDPVRTPEGDFLGGFQTTSMDSVRVPRSALDGTPGDEAIADTIRRELREDAATTDFDIEVSVNRGVVRIRGTVPTLDDAESVEEIAFRVEGVVDVYDELKISEFL
jgi:osmotically-inducible protein OsmY